jgi:hypothetical protein
MADSAGADTAEATDDRLRERAAESRLKLWVLLEADRWLVTGVLLAIVFVVLVAWGALSPGAERIIRSSDSVDTLFQGLLTATVTTVTLVVTLNQLVLSQELGAVGDQRDRMEGAMQFRQDVAAAIEAPLSPAQPARFLRALVAVAGARATDLREAVSATADDDLATDIEVLTTSVIENADKVSEGLTDARFGTFDVLSAALNFDYSWKLFTARRIRAQHGATLDDESAAALDALIDVLELFGPAREHFKTLYFQWDLITLSRRMFVAAIPALLVSGGMILFFDAARYDLVLFGFQTLVVVLSGATTVSVAPFFILLAYVVRIATVAKHTLSIGPFILGRTTDIADVEWNQ